ncbi:hypothetical protein PS718_05541 [Pseudomonas fluorescens]|uniref:Uncharacterized protein n=1 Tax=Pseudomonas fluorescens TaxID=294 RepID=A0A5E7FLP1_PSEFL|nr:hypothetical protein PS718_05541 [Pseudomonas fluorescens]
MAIHTLKNVNVVRKAMAKSPVPAPNVPGVRPKPPAPNAPVIRTKPPVRGEPKARVISPRPPKPLIKVPGGSGNGPVLPGLIVCPPGTWATKDWPPLNINDDPLALKKLLENFTSHTYPDGSVWLIDNSLVNAQQTAVMRPDGIVQYVDGRVGHPDGRIVWPDNTVEYPDGRIVWADGTEQLADGAIKYSDGLRYNVQGDLVSG